MLDSNRLQIVWSRSESDMKDSARRYVLPVGEFPSVTQVLDGNSDFLWLHIAKIREEVDRLVNISATGGSVERWVEVAGQWELLNLPAQQVLLDGDYISKAGLRYMKQAADRGTCVHFLFEAWGQGIRPDVREAEELAQWAVIEQGLRCDVKELASYLKPAILWLDKHQPEFSMQEMVVCDPVRGYAGRTDMRIMQIGDDRYIADVKSHDTLKRVWLMQLAAYRAAPVGYTLEGGNVSEVEIKDEWKQLPGCMIMCVPGKCGHRVVKPEVMDYYLDKFYHQLAVHQALTTGPLPEGRASWTKVPD